MLLTGPPRKPSRARKMVRPRRPKRPETALEIPTTVISDAAIKGLIDESVVPALVEKFIREKCPLPAEQTHNGQQL